MSIIDVAISQEGVTESGLNNIRYNTWYYGHPVQGGSYPYCAVFIAWCAEQAGLSQQVIPRTASVVSMYNFFLDQKRFHKAGSYMPVPGDIMIQRAKGASHVGIVVYSTAEGFYTIEGNAGAGVQRCFHNYADGALSGFGKPAYPEPIVLGYTESAPTTLKAVKRIATLSATASTEESNKATSENPQMTEEEIWDYFRWRGYSAEAAAGIMGRMKCESSGYSPKWTAIYHVGNTEYGGMGMFQWTWGAGSSAAASTYAIQSDLTNGRLAYPDSRLTSYLDWCDKNKYEYETCIGQLEYLWNVDLNSQEHVLYTGHTFRPAELNGMSVAEVANLWTSQYERGNPSNEVAEGEAIYEKYKDRAVPTGDTFSVTGTTVTGGAVYSGGTKNQGMQATEVSIEDGVGRYKYESYTVASGDTLESIAKKYNTTPQLIMWANNLNEWAVTAGNTIKVPTLTSAALSETEAVAGVGSLAQLTHSMKVEVSHPSVIVEFYGEYGKLAAKSTLVSDKNEHVDNDIISVSTTRNIGQDCPTFVISLVWRNKWYDNLASNDMLIITMWRPPEKKAVVLYGLVDDIRRTLDWSSGQPQRAVQVSGRGFNKTLCQFNIGMLENYASLTEANGFFTSTDSTGARVGLTDLNKFDAAGCIEVILKAYIGKALKFKFGNGKELKDYVTWKLSSVPNTKLTDYSSFTQFNGTMWNFLKELSNLPFEETYWEVVDDKPTIIHRPTPFEKDNWTALPRKTVYDYDLVSNNTGRSDYETFTIFNSTVIQADQAAQNLWPPVWYPPFYPKYGVKEYKASSLFAFNSSVSKGLYDPTKYSAMLFNFYIKNNVFENGTLSVKGSNQWKIGERVILESEDIEYYIEGVSHNFNMYASWITTLSVTRGLHPAERFTPPYGAGEDFRPEDIDAIVSMTSGVEVDWSTITKKTYAVRNADGTTSANFTGSTSGSAVGVGGQWYSYMGRTWTHPAPQCTIITSPFGLRDAPTYGASTYHKGIDLACEGDAAGKPIVAAGDGKVVWAGAVNNGYGCCIDIYHGDGLLTRYAHMFPDTLKVSAGQQVVAGQYIADIGNNGVGTGAHLHFELHTDADDGEKQGTAINPEALFQTATQAPASVQQQYAEEKPKDDYSEYNTINTNSSMNDIAESCYRFLTQKLSLNKCAACAILGVIQFKSRFQLTGTGLFKLSSLTNLQSYCAAHQYEVNSVAGQLGYMYNEMQNSRTKALQVVQQATNTKDSVRAVAKSFRRAWDDEPSDYDNDTNDPNDQCGTYAEDWWEHFD